MMTNEAHDPVVVKSNHTTLESHCPVCGGKTRGRVPAELFFEGGKQPLCFHCGFVLAGDLAQLLAQSYQLGGHVMSDEREVVY